MGLPPSRIINGVRALDTDDARVFHAYGEPDDPLRLSVLLTEHAAGLLKKDPDPCLDPRASWQTRCDALGDLFDELRAHDRPIGVLVDLDALAFAPTPRDAWEDPLTPRMQMDIFHLICQSVERGGWILVRPSPTPDVSKRLAGIPIEEPSEEIRNISLAFSPETRPISNWLLAKNQLREQELLRIINTEHDPDDYITAMGYEALPQTAREAAQQIQVLRPPCVVNGSFGPFPWGADASKFQVDRSEVQFLCKSGFLQQASSGTTTTMRMHRHARRVISRRLPLLRAGWTIDAHRWLGEQDKGTNVERLIEAHYHAARSGHVDLALKTARFYGYELRALATALSRDQRDYKNAAMIFQHVIDHFEPTDAYAWEYLGFNLALWDVEDDRRGRHQGEVLEAYHRAYELDGNNPLYHGRWMGFRAELKQDIEIEFDRAVAKYLNAYGERGDALSRFVMPVFDGLTRSRRHRDREHLLSKWQTVFKRCCPKVLDKFARDFGEDDEQIPAFHVAQTAVSRARRTPWLEDLYKLSHCGADDEGADLIFDTIDDLLQERRFSQCDEALQAVDVERLTIALMVALLSITVSAKEVLRERANLADRIERRLRLVAPERLEGLLKGLR